MPNCLTTVLNWPLRRLATDIPALVITSILTGLLVATYISTDPIIQEDRSLKIGGLGGFFSFIAVGLLLFATRKRILNESNCSINLNTNKTKGKWA